MLASVRDFKISITWGIRQKINWRHNGNEIGFFAVANCYKTRRVDLYARDSSVSSLNALTKSVDREKEQNSFDLKDG